MEDVPTPGQVIVDKFLRPNNLTMYKLAKAIHKPQAVITMFVRGDRSISPDMATRIGKALNVNPEYLMAVDSRYQLSKIKEEDVADVETLVDEQEKQGEDFFRNGGWVYSQRLVDDAALGRAVRGAMAGASEINDGRDELLKSINDYCMYGIISIPGNQQYYEYKEDVPLGAIGIFTQFLIAAGEDPQAVHDEVHEQRVKIYHEAGKFDVDGLELSPLRRSVKCIDVNNIGELLLGASQLETGSANEVYSCLYTYAHDEIIVLPSNEDAAALFEQFIKECEGYGRLLEIRKHLDESHTDRAD